MSCGSGGAEPGRVEQAPDPGLLHTAVAIVSLDGRISTAASDSVMTCPWMIASVFDRSPRIVHKSSTHRSQIVHASFTNRSRDRVVQRSCSNSFNVQRSTNDDTIT